MAKHDGYKFWREKLNGARFVLAPMVDQSELPWRMLSRKYSTQLCYTPMIHAGLFVRDLTYRAENFSTCPEDRPLVAQFCTDDPEIFVKAAELIQDKCDAIDLNLGCPQHIARRGHYGSFLQDEWELIHKILSHAVENLKVPVTAKIRVFEDIGKTVEYAKMVESTGISILTVHGRTRDQKGPNTGLASWEHIRAVKRAVKIPVFANGNILNFNDVLESLKQTECDGVMVAEPNLFNPALFSGLNPCTYDIAYEYMELVEKYPCSLACIRAHLYKIFQKVFEIHKDYREKMGKIRSNESIKECILEIKEAILKENEGKKRDETSTDLDYWLCQSHLRPIPSESLTKKREEIKKLVEEKISNDSSDPNALKRHIEELTSSLSEQTDKEQKESLIKCSAVIERKKRKLEKNERKLKYFREIEERKAENRKLKYASCGTSSCKNPKGEKCENGLCRVCCKDKVFTDMVDCKGHGIKYKRKEVQKDENGQSESNSKNIQDDNLKKDITTLDNTEVVN